MVMCITALSAGGMLHMREEHIESAAELAREHGVPPKMFRDALRKRQRCPQGNA